MNNVLKLATMARRNSGWERERGDREYDRREDYGRRDEYDRGRRESRRYDRDYAGRERYPEERRYPEYEDPRRDPGYPMSYGSEHGRYPRRDYEKEDGYFFKVKGKFGRKNEMRHEEMPEEFDRELAEEWVSSMKRADGKGKGGQWTMEQTNQLMKQKGYHYDPEEFFAVCNMLHSDYSKTLAKYGINSPDAYAELAKDWLDDDDIAAGYKKTLLYYECIMK